MSPKAQLSLEREADDLLMKGKVFQYVRLYKTVNRPVSVQKLIECGNELLRQGNMDAAVEAFVSAAFEATEPD